MTLNWTTNVSRGHAVTDPVAFYISSETTQRLPGLFQVEFKFNLQKES